MQTRSKIVTGAATIALAGAVAVAVPAFADTTSPTPSSSPSSSSTDTTKDAGGPFKASLDKLVKAGTITQAQADKVLSQVQADRPAKGDGPGRGRGGHGGPGGMGRMDSDVLKTAAATLKLTEDQLKEKMTTMSLGEIADAQKVSRSTLVTALQKAMSADLTDRITQMLDRKPGQAGPRDQGSGSTGSPTATPSTSGAAA